jgi:hypothetical protein
MHRLVIAPALAVVTLLACSFDATGLGDEVGRSPAPAPTGVTRSPAGDTDSSTGGASETCDDANTNFCRQGACGY